MVIHLAICTLISACGKPLSSLVFLPFPYALLVCCCVFFFFPTLLLIHLILKTLRGKEITSNGAHLITLPFCCL